MAGAVKFEGILSRIRNSAGTLFGPRGHVRFNDSATVTWTVTDDPTNDEVDISAAAAGGGGAHDHTVADGSGVLTGDEHDSFSEYAEIATPGTPAANKLRLYAKDDAAVTKLFYKSDNGVEVGPLQDAGVLPDHNHSADGGGAGGILTGDRHDEFSEYDEVVAPATPAANRIRLYSRDKAGVSELFYKNDGGTERDLSLAGGAGAAEITRIAGASGASGADITLQRLTANSVDVTTVALSAAIMTTTGLGVGLWHFRYVLSYQTAATTTGIGFGVNHTGTVTKFRGLWTHITTGATAATGVGDDVGAVVPGQMAEGKTGGTLNAVIGSASAGVATINSDVEAVLEGILVVTVSGNLELKIATEIAGSAVRVMADSFLYLTKIG